MIFELLLNKDFVLFISESYYILGAQRMINKRKGRREGKKAEETEG